MRWRSSVPAEDDRLLVVGLGNPGSRYERTRHNLGRVALGVLVERTDARLKRHRSRCMVAEVRLEGRRVVLAYPLTYMNESGGPVAELVRWYSAAPGQLVVLHDELDIPFADVRVKAGGGTAGHNGLRSLAAHLRSPAFARVRIGVGRPRGERDPVDWVLTEPSAAERRELPAIVDRAADAGVSMAARGLDATMYEFNTRSRKSQEDARP
jgi:peptidyl-tRNA hydrolase, PTH1 family